MTPHLKIYIIIVTHNGAKWISDCLFSVMANKHFASEIVVVDNASWDKTVKLVESNFPDVNIFRQKRNVGYGRGANIGMKYALSRGADYIFLLNQDIKLGEHCIRNMIEVCEKNRLIGIASPLQLNYNGSAIDPKFRELYSLQSEDPHMNNELFKDSFAVDTIIGASMLFRASVIESIGMFDPIYFLYHEEGDLCRRARFHGFEIHVIPKATVLHKHLQLFPQNMSIQAKFAATYGYYFYILKNPFSPLSRNIGKALKQMGQWVWRDRILPKIVKRFLVAGAATCMIMIYLYRIVKNRRSDIALKATAEGMKSIEKIAGNKTF
ncbi:MAG: glycosyltransferase family 2 protein [Syntrophales bacterium]